jgi:hypothetical protein
MTIVATSRLQPPTLAGGCRHQKISLRTRTTTAKPMRKMTPMVPPINLSINILLFQIEQGSGEPFELRVPSWD